MQGDYFPLLYDHNRLLAITTSGIFLLKLCFDVEQLRYCILPLKILSHPKNYSENYQVSLLLKNRTPPSSIKRKNILKLMKIGLLGANHFIPYMKMADYEEIKIS